MPFVLPQSINWVSIWNTYASLVIESQKGKKYCRCRSLIAPGHSILEAWVLRSKDGIADAVPIAEFATLSSSAFGITGLVPSSPVSH